MKKFLVILFLLVSSINAFGGSAQPLSNVFEFGGQSSSAGPNLIVPFNSTVTSLITIWAATSSSSANNVLAFYKNGVQYQVTSGKTFVAPGYSIFSSGAQSGYQFCTSTASFSNNVATGSLTGPVYWAGTANNPMAVSAGSATDKYIANPVSFAATLFPCVQTITASVLYSIVMTGQEF